MKPSRCLHAASLLSLGILGIVSANAQTPEITTKEAPVTFKSGINLVPVTVVVRDSKGNAIGTLGIEDFQLFDNGKPQMISKFSVEKLFKDAPAAKPVSPAPDKPANNGAALTDAQSDGIPDRFVAYFFDDLHTSIANLAYSRDAARRQIDSSMHPLERTAIYTTSGQPMQDFTADKAKLHAALLALNGSHASATKSQEQMSCPPMSYYMGDQITNKNDTQALDIAITDTIRCANLPPTQRQQATSLAQQAARQAALNGDRETALSLDSLRSVVSKLASMPGQRTLVLVSDGFLVGDDRREEETGLIERAIRANVIIGALDARGLHTDTGMPDASEANVNPGTIAQKSQIRRIESMVQSDVMAVLAAGTGGTFYQGTNDYDEGITRTAAAPDYLYVLGFSPLDLKLDGKYHTLKVTLKNMKGFDLQVRKGYYAPKFGTDPAEQAKQQIEETFFSHDEIHDLPAVLQTQYFKADNGDVTLSTVAKIDIRKLAFRKEAGRNLDNLTVVTGLFDNDGNYVTGIQKIVEMKLLDETLEKRAGSGIALKNSFAVHTGRYMVRMVVRDSEGQLMTAQSGLVDIP